jgi:hypothetical protein
MPMLVGDDGEPTDSAFLAAAAIRRNGQSIANREGIPLKAITVKPRPYKVKAKRGRAKPSATRS